MPRVLSLLLLLSILPMLLAQEKPRAIREASKEAAKPKETTTAVTPEREAAVNMFVSRQHPELGDLLKQLKDTNPRQYDKAVRELFVSSEHLAQLQETDSRRYELELQVWKLHSRMQLLSAKITMNPTEELQQELKMLVADHYDARRELLTHERDKIRDRMKKADKDLADYETRREASIKKQFELLTTHPKTKPEKKKEGDKSVKTTAP